MEIAKKEYPRENTFKPKKVVRPFLTYGPTLKQKGI